MGSPSLTSLSRTGVLSAAFTSLSLGPGWGLH
jgi:hypothetical protein